VRICSPTSGPAARTITRVTDLAAPQTWIATKNGMLDTLLAMIESGETQSAVKRRRAADAHNRVICGGDLLLVNG